MWYNIDFIPWWIGILNSTRWMQFLSANRTSSDERECRLLFKWILYWFLSLSSNLNRTRRVAVIVDVVVGGGRIEVVEIENCVGCVMVKFVWDDDESIRDYLCKE